MSAENNPNLVTEPSIDPQLPITVPIEDRYETLAWELVMASHHKDIAWEAAVAGRLDRVGWLNGTVGLVATLFGNCVHNAHPGGVTANTDIEWLDTFAERCVTKHDHVRWVIGRDSAAAFVINIMPDRPDGMAEVFQQMTSSLISRYRATLIEVLIDDYLRRPDETFEQALIEFMRLSLRTQHQQIERGALTLPYPPADPDTWQPPQSSI